MPVGLELLERAVVGRMGRTCPPWGRVTMLKADTTTTASCVAIFIYALHRRPKTNNAAPLSSLALAAAAQSARRDQNANRPYSRSRPRSAILRLIVGWGRPPSLCPLEAAAQLLHAHAVAEAGGDRDSDLRSRQAKAGCTRAARRISAEQLSCEPAVHARLHAADPHRQGQRSCERPAGRPACRRRRDPALACHSTKPKAGEQPGAAHLQHFREGSCNAPFQQSFLPTYRGRHVSKPFHTLS